MLNTDWPFFEPRHEEVTADLWHWLRHHWSAGDFDGIDDLDQRTRAIVRSLGAAGILRLCVAGKDGALPDVRSLALAREALARHDALADFAFAMQGLGSGAISIAGSAAQRDEWLDPVASGTAIAAYALTEPATGSDAANIAMAARANGESWRLDGEKSYISNGTIADVLTVFARTGTPDEGAKGITAFIVRGDDPGLSVAERIDVISPHPLARLAFDGVRAERLGAVGGGFKLAMQTLDLFRVTVGAAALGMAEAALSAATAHAKARPLGAGTLADNAVTMDRLGAMATRLDGAALLVARAAWQQDTQSPDHAGPLIRRAAAMAKLEATEAAQAIIDKSLQLHGGLGVTVGSRVEALYRDIRALRIYEGASEVQRMIIGRGLVK